MSSVAECTISFSRGINKIFSAYQLCQFIKFTNDSGTLSVPVIRAVMKVCVETVPHTFLSRADTRGWVRAIGVNGWSHFLAFLGIRESLHCLRISVTGYQDQLRMKSLSLKWFCGDTDTSRLLCHVVDIVLCGVIQDGVAAETDMVPCFKSVLCHSAFIWLAQAGVSHVFFTSGFDGSVSLYNTDITALTGHRVFSGHIQATFLFFRRWPTQLFDTITLYTW